MPRLFIFAIGGTGSRVVKSLIMLLAAGVKINASEIVPIIIDPDSTNGDMQRTIDILRFYQRIHNQVQKSLSDDRSSEKEHYFFKTKIRTLQAIAQDADANSTVSEIFRYSIDGAQEGRFEEFIDLSSLDSINTALVNLLYSEANLGLRLDEGFKGNPNIGSVVLNKFKDSEEFKQFASIFRQDDRIFIISSIFGGTGAAGFPLMLKNFRNADPDEVNNSEFLRDARIGALSVLPYFGVTPQRNGMIDKDTFTSKTKAALSYYKRNIIDNKSLNALYYVGDDISQDYDYSEGQSSQKNKAHLVELIGATGIVHFMNYSNPQLNSSNGKAEKTFVNEYSLKEEKRVVNFNHLDRGLGNFLLKPLSRYAYFCLYLRKQFRASLNNHPWSVRGDVKIDREFVNNSEFFANLTAFNDHFWVWLDEMARNERGLALFDLNVDEDVLDRFIIGVEPKKGMFKFGKSWKYDYYDSELNSAERKLGSIPVEYKLLKLFYLATQSILDKKFSIG